MIQMGDQSNKGGVDLEDFIILMKNLGLIPKEKTPQEDELEEKKAF